MTICPFRYSLSVFRYYVSVTMCPFRYCVSVTSWVRSVTICFRSVTICPFFTLLLCVFRYYVCVPLLCVFRYYVYIPLLFVRYVLRCPLLVGSVPLPFVSVPLPFVRFLRYYVSVPLQTREEGEK